MMLFAVEAGHGLARGAPRVAAVLREERDAVTADDGLDEGTTGKRRRRRARESASTPLERI